MTPPSPWGENVERVREAHAQLSTFRTSPMAMDEHAEWSEKFDAALAALTAQMEEMERQRDLDGQAAADYERQATMEFKRAEAAEARVEELEEARSRVETWAAKQEGRAFAAERALREAGDLLFGTWDDDSTSAERSRKAEAIFRAVLFKTPESTDLTQDAKSV